MYNKIKTGKSNKKDDIKDFIVKNYNKILMKNSFIGRGTSLSHNTYIGYDSIVGDSCSLSKCIIGNKCKIGDQVILKNCIILDNCEIYKKSIYQNCLI